MVLSAGSWIAVWLSTALRKKSASGHRGEILLARLGMRVAAPPRWPRNWASCGVHRIWFPRAGARAGSGATVHGHGGGSIDGAVVTPTVERRNCDKHWFSRAKIGWHGRDFTGRAQYTCNKRWYDSLRSQSEPAQGFGCMFRTVLTTDANPPVK